MVDRFGLSATAAAKAAAFTVGFEILFFSAGAASAAAASSVEMFNDSIRCAATTLRSTFGPSTTAAALVPETGCSAHSGQVGGLAPVTVNELGPARASTV